MEIDVDFSGLLGQLCGVFCLYLVFDGPPLQLLLRSPM